ncbi:MULTISPECIES: NACHT domain-containing protein [Streptomyces griseus group]|uniref:NACHT domain-containing protein n=1 Tax=Streptomyces griseus group TaxID=629295 RepID=UPI0009A0F4AC|nr:NACHT domain-containing protein [Streptomyces griseus]
MADMVNADVTAFAEVLRADLMTFVDPGTEPEITARGGGLLVRWSHDFDEREALFTWDGSREKWVVEQDGKRVDYASFIAGPELADLRALAKNIVQVLGRQRSGRYVPGRARLSGGVDEDAATLVERSSVSEDEATKIVFVTGDAGAGKSRMLSELTYEAAVRYLRGESSYLYFNVSAQGRGLARLNEALATELQDLRARMTYHSVARLVRHGQLRLIVDGFDELIGGQGSYEEAFGSLAGFIEELDGRGSVIAAARSVYYEQEFLARTNSSSELGSLLWSLVPVEMRLWGTVEVDAYLQGFAPAVRTRVRSLRDSPEAEGTLLDKPLFLARTCELMEAENQSIESGRPLLGQLVDAYVQREVSSKLVGQHGQYLSGEQYVELLTEIAIEMWRQKTRELNRATLHDLVSIFAQLHELPTEAQQNLVDAAASRAMLKLGTKPGTVAFEHDLFFGFFLAKPIEEALIRGSQETASILRRANLPVEAARAAVGGVLESGSSGQDVLSVLALAVDPNDSFAEVVGRNAGTLAAEVLRLRGTAEKHLMVQNVTFADADTSGLSVRGASLVGIRFERSDLRNTQFESCVARDVGWHLVVIDPETTRLDFTGVTPADFVGLRVAGSQGVEQDFVTSSILRRLRACGLGADIDEVRTRDIADSVVAVVEKIARHYSRSNMLCTDDGAVGALAVTPVGQRVLNAAEDSGVVRREPRATSGRPKVFYRRMVLPETLLAGLVEDAPVPPAVADFWSRLTEVA